jgi:cytochrome c oxidase accessory protein FixG
MNQNTENFRDTIVTVNEKGKRVWIYPRKQKGKYHSARGYVALFLLLFLLVVPGIKVNGHPLMLLNVLDRKFILFGFAFGPQDFFLFVILTISIVIFTILFTAIYGRIFCGWVCPQTVFMEMVFRKIEYWIEGDAEKQKSLEKSGWTGIKLFKKTLKHLIFILIAVIMSNMLVAWVVGFDELLSLVNSPPSSHFSAFIAMAVISGFFYFIFSSFREQACTILCPYGRLQGVLLDPNSLVIAYDYKRGEPRGIFKKNRERKIGDCVDCSLCVKVCPTGIDIRNGTQLECINCTLCIDACDMIMNKVKLPEGLIRYDSMSGIEGSGRKKFTPRNIGYTVMLFILVGVLAGLFMSRNEINTTLLRKPGALFQEYPGGKVSNLYSLKIVNNTFTETTINLKTDYPDAEIKIPGKELTLPPLGNIETEFLILIPKEKLKIALTKLTIVISKDKEIINEVKTNFLYQVK